MKNPTFLSAQLRESAPYLTDAGWRQTAALLLAAADEIETLRARLDANADAPIAPPQDGMADESSYDVIPFPHAPPNAKRA